ncbi:MAG TPA: hypothetical protein VK028_12965 [Micromonosporaceae bacterium]|nr:hypothetical protein [Micromonosporaceae bacterium]
MIKRLFWLGAGVAVGVLVVRKLSQAAHSYSPSGLAGSAKETAAGFMDSVRDFIADVKEGMAIREAEINAAFEQGVMLDAEDGDWNDEPLRSGPGRGAGPEREDGDGVRR